MKSVSTGEVCVVRPCLRTERAVQDDRSVRAGSDSGSLVAAEEEAEPKEDRGSSAVSDGCFLCSDARGGLRRDRAMGQSDR